MNLPTECIICPEHDKTKCFECWKKKVVKGEIILTEEERQIFNRKVKVIEKLIEKL